MIQIPPDRLEKKILDAIIEAFILREGTDYGEREVDLSDKVNQVRRDINSGKVVLVFDEESESCNLMTQRAYNESVNGQ